VSAEVGFLDIKMSIGVVFLGIRGGRGVKVYLAAVAGEQRVGLLHIFQFASTLRRPLAQLVFVRVSKGWPGE